LWSLSEEEKRKRYSGQLEIAPKKYYFYTNSNKAFLKAFLDSFL